MVEFRGTPFVVKYLMFPTLIIVSGVTFVEMILLHSNSLHYVPLQVKFDQLFVQEQND